MFDANTIFYCIAFMGLIVSMWRLCTCLTVIASKGFAEKDKERQDLIRLAEHAIEKSLTPTHQHVDVSALHMRERAHAFERVTPKEAVPKDNGVLVSTDPDKSVAPYV